MKLLKEPDWSANLTCINCAAEYEVDENDIEVNSGKYYSYGHYIFDMIFVPCPNCGFTYKFPHPGSLSIEERDWIINNPKRSGFVPDVPLNIFQKGKEKYEDKQVAISKLKEICKSIGRW